VSECPDCDGDGEIGAAIKTGRKIPNPEQRFLVNGIKFKARNILSVFNVAKLLDIESVNWVVQEADKANIFTANDIIIVMMPMMQGVEGDSGLIINV
jgi:hypothetical protein